MSTISFIDDVGECVELLKDSLQKLYGNVMRISYHDLDNSLIVKGKHYIKSEIARYERIKKVYECFSNEFKTISDKYLKEMEDVKSEADKEYNELMTNANILKTEISETNEKISREKMDINTNISFVYNNSKKSKVDINLALKHSGSYFYKELMGGNRDIDGNVFIDRDEKNDELIVKFMNDDNSICDDIKNMTLEKKLEFVDDLTFFQLKFNKDVVKELGLNEDSKIIDAWKNRKTVMVNGNNETEFTLLLKKYNLIDILFSNTPIKKIQYHSEANAFFIDLKMDYLELVWDYLRNDRKQLDEALIRKFEGDDANDIIFDFKQVGIQLGEPEKKELERCLVVRNVEKNLFINQSKIIKEEKHDIILQKWFDSKYKWKLLYRASDHDFTADSFHEYCDDKGPTLTIIKSSDGWIFGGFTSQSWSRCMFILCCSLATRPGS